MTELPYHSDTLGLYRRLESLGTAVLLESCGTTAQARWDILAAGATPAQTITLPATLNAEETLATVETLRHQIRRVVSSEEVITAPDTGTRLPFCGGYVGHFSYELGRRLQGLAPRLTRMPLAVVRHYPWAIVQDREQQKSWLVGDCSEVTRENIRRRLQDPASRTLRGDSPFELLSNFRHPWSRELYIECFDKVRDYLLNGDCYQINIGQPFRAAYRGDLLEAYAALRDVAAAPFSAYFPLTDDATLLSLSPERFLQIRDRRVETRPIKGTRPRSTDPAVDQNHAWDLLRSPKERAENLMIVDLLRNDLGRYCATGSVRVDELYRLETYATVHHLTSVISGELQSDVNPLDLLLGSLPGGSITGAPKVRAMELIDDLECEPRQSWCGNVFYLSEDGQMDSSITIRSLFADGESLTCWAGGGLVIDSEADSEYQEQRDKVGALLRCLEERSEDASELGQLEIAK